MSNGLDSDSFHRCWRSHLRLGYLHMSQVLRLRVSLFPWLWNSLLPRDLSDGRVVEDSGSGLESTAFHRSARPCCIIFSIKPEPCPSASWRALNSSIVNLSQKARTFASNMPLRQPRTNSTSRQARYCFRLSSVYPMELGHTPRYTPASKPSGNFRQRS